MVQKKQIVNYQKAMEMLNTSLQEMKSEMSQVDGMKLTGSKNQMATHMHSILETIQQSIAQYANTQSQEDFNSVCRQLETLKPSFIINFNEICYDKGLDMLNTTLTVMATELKEIDKKKWSGNQSEKAQKMHAIYDEISNFINKFASSHDQSDFSLAVKAIESQKPQFVLNYNELCS